MSYRQYLQYHANNHPSDIKRSEAQALLNVVGDDTNIDGNFLTGEKVDRGWVPCARRPREDVKWV